MPAAVALAARIVLAAALAIAAFSKLRHLGPVRVQMDALIGRSFARVAAIVVPLVELTVAVALVVAIASPVPGVTAAVVLIAFTVVLVRAEARHVPCPCFGGGASTAAVGPRSVLRNGVLVAVAVLATADATGAPVAATVLWCAVFGAIASVVVIAADRQP